MRRETFVGTVKDLNTFHVRFDCVEVSYGGRLSEFLRLTTSYLSTKIEGSRDNKTLIQNGEVFKPACPNPAGPN